MTYAGHRAIIDSDSHLIELDDFLSNAATEEEFALIPTIESQGNLPVEPAAMARARELFEKRRASPETMAKFEAGLRDTSKNGWSRLGAFDPNERSHTLDLLGFRLQLVLPTFAFHQVGHLTDPDAAEVGARVLNRAMAGFCAHDDRLLAIGYVPLRLGPDRACALIDRGFADGCYSFMLDTNEPDATARSFTHPDFDPVWARFEAASVPFVSHVAVNGEYRAVSPSFRNNGSAIGGLGGDAGESLLDLVTIKNSVEIFFSAMVFDGVFERHPGLRGISMEHGAFWLPSWMHALDYTARTARRLIGDRERPSDTVRRHLRFSPFAGEPVGWIIENVGSGLLVFGSDYPHPEGTSDPIARFESAMTECDPDTFDRFYHRNMEELLGVTVV